MSMLFRDANGIEHPVAGLNGTSGELVPSVSYYQSGNKTSDTTSWSTGETGTFSVNLSENMPDADYIVVPTLSVVGVSAIVHAKTVNSFRVTVRNDRAETITQAITLYWQAFKLMTDENRALDEQAIADIQAVVPANATSSNKLVTANEFAETSGSATLASGLSGGITWVKIGRIVQVRVNNVLKSSGAIGAGATLCTGLPRQKNVTSFCIARYPNEANVVDLTGNGELRQTGMYSVATGIGLFGDFTYISAS